MHIGIRIHGAKSMRINADRNQQQWENRYFDNKKIISLANLLVNVIAHIKTVTHMVCNVAFLRPRGVVDLKYFLL
jgi:hypothetical protein